MQALLLTIPEVARALNIGRTMAYGLVASGEIPAIRIGRGRRVRREDVKAWIDRQRDEAGAQGGSDGSASE